MSIELDNAQRSVAQAPADARVLVIAGAGQGKTEVVAARLRFLTEEKELSASTETMVLSFSRAAVHAVRRRIELHDLAETNVRTFDSFASYLLLENDKEPVGGFDDRIRQATRLLHDGDAEIEGIDELRHLVLDEVQDLAGDRAEMILALLYRLDADAGFTALGDPLQGIYDFTLRTSKAELTSSEFFGALETDFGADRVALERNYRARGEFPQAVVTVGDQLRSTRGSDDALARIGSFTCELPHSGIVREWSFLSEATGTVAILCETNGEVLRVSRLLGKAGVRHVVRRSSRSFGAARWLADVFEDLAGPQVSRSDVESAIEARLPAPQRDDAWYLLKGAEGFSRSMHQLDLARLHSRIKSGAIPLGLTEPGSVDVIVSTIHRAKGLEFDHVYLVHRDFRHEDADRWAEVRARYVALSRARDDVSVIDTPAEWSWFDGRRPGRQRERKKSKKKNFYTAAVEIVGTDVADGRPPTVTGVVPVETQAALRRLESGTEVTGVCVERSIDDDAPIFVLRTPEGDDIGVTNEQFGQLIVDDFGYRYPNAGDWEGMTIGGIRVGAVETVATDSRITEEAGLGSSGLWLVPRVSGLVAPS